MLVSDPLTIERLCEVKLLHHLAPFVARECTLPQAASELEITSRRMSYWVNKFVNYKLIQFVRFEKHGRHQAAVYRSVHDEFVFNLAAINEEHAMGLLQAIQGPRFEQLQRSIARNFTRRGKHAQFRIWRAESGVRSLLFNTKDANDTFGLTSNFYQLSLSADDIEALHRELRELCFRYLEKSDKRNPQ
ncbi:MAG: hypothetical protein ACRCWJ_03735, partial [Casimicrobium sp.]